MVNLDHLRPEARVVAMLPCEQRLAHLNLERWIGYTRAHQALTQLETLFIEEPGKIRPQNLLIIGASNNGKTMIAEKNLNECMANKYQMMESMKSFPLS